TLLHRGGWNPEEVKDERSHHQHDHQGEDEGIGPFPHLALLPPPRLFARSVSGRSAIGPGTARPSRVAPLIGFHCLRTCHSLFLFGRSTRLPVVHTGGDERWLDAE